MSDLSKRLSKLTPEQRELLQKKLSKSIKKKEKIEKRPDQSVYEMSSAQKRLWFLNQMDPKSVFYNIPSAIRLHGKIDIELLQKSINKVIERHEVLRSYYITNDNGEPEQKIDNSAKIELNQIDISSANTEEVDSSIQKTLKEEAAKSFDISEAPLLRASLIKIAPDDHVLCVNMHHIIADGWSIGIFIQEITYLIQNHNSASATLLPDLSIQFADYSAWQLQQSNNDKINKQLEYWKTALKGMPNFLELHTDHSRPSVMTANGKHHLFSIDQLTSTKIKNLAKENQVSPYSILMAAFQIFLYKISGQEDFGVGAPIANRNRKEIENLIGFFVNTIVLRARFEEDISFNSLVKHISSDVAEASDNQDVPFDSIVESLVPKRELSYSPLFQVMFDFQSAPILGSKELKVDILDIEIEVAKFDLLLLMLDTPDGIKCTFEYNTDLFATPTIVRFSQFFTTLIKAITSNPDQMVSELSLIDEAATKKIIYDWNKTESKYSSEASVHELFEKQVEKSPDSIAVSYGEYKVNYRELNENANKLAHYLINNGVEKGAHVALYMERSIEMITSFIAILKAGGVYVPLDTSYPKERLTFMLEDSNAVILLSQEQLADKLPETDIQILNVDFSEEKINKINKTTNPDINISSGEKAYIIYTSGSTGKPKGVVVPHKAITRLVLNTNYVDFSKSIVMAQVSNASFDAATFEIWGALLNGGKLVGIKKEIMLSTKNFVAELRKHKINTSFVTVAFFNQIISEVPDAFKTFDTLMFGGEAATPSSVYKAFKSGPPKRLLNGYGPTENTTFSCWYEVKNIEENATNVPIGKPIANSTCYVLDKNLKIVPVGVPGELFVGGDGLALGYHDREDLTNERFIADPFSKKPGARMYKTGDLVAYLEDGNIEFISRIDQQVKLRGFRIELGEIESILKNHPEIDESIVLARKNKNDETQLVAYIIKKNNNEIESSNIKTFLLKSLPDYMVPVIYITIDKIPHTPNGKIDRKALPDPEDYRPAVKNKFIAARNDLEKLLVKTWQDILGLNQVGVYDNFFDIGGNSLKAAVFTNRIQKEFNETMHVGAIFKAPTVAELAMYINEYFPEKIKSYFGSEIKSADEYKIILSEDGEIEKIKQDDIDLFSSLIHPLAELPAEVSSRSSKNPRAVFLLSPPRSGSTLMRVMLAGNKNLFSPPELDLLTFNTLQERKEAFSKDGLQIWLESPLQAIMEAKSCDVEKAKMIMADFESKKLSVKDFYFEMQNWLSDKLIVDKTPTYAFDPNILKRMEEDFEDPLYIHLVRHPYAMIYSFIEAKLDQNFFRHKHSFSRRELAELIWIISNRNIVEFLQSVPEERQVQIRFEDILADPKSNMENLCRFMNIDFSNDMLKPYEGKKMTAGISENSQMVGDFKFYLHKNINSSVADKWRTYHSNDFLSDSSWEIAEQFGYAVEKDIAKNQNEKSSITSIPAVPRDEDLVLSFAQERLWFLDQMNPNDIQYNIPSAIRIKGELKKEILKKSLNEIVNRHETLRTIFQSSTGKALQLIIQGLSFPIIEHDISNRSLSQEELDNEALKIANEEVAKPFNLATGPLIRSLLLKVAEDEFILVLVFHHIISDGWSGNIFINELASLYNSLSQGNQPSLPQLPIQYADFASWQREWLSEERLQSQQSFWENQLKNAPPLIELSTDFPRTQSTNFDGKRDVFHIPENLYLNLKKLSKKHNTTLFTTLLAAFVTFLYRYSNQDDITVGTPTANRTRSEIEPLIGFFVNTLVLRSFLNDNMSFTDLLNQLKKTTADAFDNQDIPFEKLVNALQPERETTHSPLFQVMFSLQHSEIQKIELQDLSIRPFNFESSTSKFDLSLEMVEHTNRLVGIFEYKTDLFKEETINRMIDHFQFLLDEFVKDQDQLISKTKLFDAEDQKALLQKWNSAIIDYQNDGLIHQQFERQAKKTPDVTAVHFDIKSFTYNELNLRSNRLARYLQRKNAKAESIIGILMDRSTDMIEAILAIMKTGAAYLPLDPIYPTDRIQYMLEDSNAKLLLTKGNLAQNLSLGKTEIINIDKLQDEFAGEDSSNLNTPVLSDNLAYIIYTSGSTGKPKGVMVKHQSALNLAANLDKEIYRAIGGEKQRISLNAPIPFDASMQQIVMLTKGHELYIIPNDARNSGENLLEYIQKHKISVLDCVPSQLKLLLEAGLLNPGTEAPKAVLPGGEAIDASTWQTLCEAPNTEFFNMYGPTECTVDSSICRVSENSEQPTIGKAIANAQFYVLDKYLQPVPLGVAGELHISGEGLARGYLNRPGLTADKFIPDPFSKNSGSRMYKSGDLVRQLPNGNLDFVGRVDHQVKVRGFRMELGEIEAVLKNHAQIKDAVVNTFEDGNEGKRLSAYLISDIERPVISDLRDHLKQSLPEYMIPAFFTFLDEFPLTPNGKINLKALPKPEVERDSLNTEFIDATSDAEKILVQIWKEVLSADKIGINDNFFELGGDSILSIQVIARAKSAGINITPKNLFDAPTISGLAALAGEIKVINAQQGMVSGAVPLTAVQHYFFDRDLARKEHWNQSIMLATSQQFEPEILKNTIAKIIEHHDALRLQYTFQDGIWHQSNIEKLAEAPFHYFDFSSAPSENQLQKVLEETTKLQKNLNLENGPIIQSAYFKLSGNLQNRLFITINHLAVDGVSWRILMEDIQNAYVQLSSGKEAQLPPKTTSFQYWSEQINKYAQSANLEKEHAFWLEQTSPNVAGIPIDFSKGENLESSLKTIESGLEKITTDALLKDVPGVYNTQINDALLTALLRAIQKGTGQNNLLLDLEGHGREEIIEDADVSRTVGWFTSVYPLKLSTTGVSDIAETLKSVKEQLRAIPNKGIGFGLLRYLSSSPEKQKLADLAKPEIVFNYLGQFDQRNDSSGQFMAMNDIASPERSDLNLRSHLIDVSISIVNGELKTNFGYSENFFLEETIQKLSDDFINELRQLITHCQEVESGSYTPSDFEEADLDQDELDDILSDFE
ncbi:MAG: amino acid adenylation domain-containing protein [Calditrichaeota bacterium]|nr:amino acid adenylation domain-containing protein [Calditrichota bacterium]